MIYDRNQSATKENYYSNILENYIYMYSAKPKVGNGKMIILYLWNSPPPFSRAQDGNEAETGAETSLFPEHKPLKQNWPARLCRQPEVTKTNFLKKQKAEFLSTA